MKISIAGGNGGLGKSIVDKLKDHDVNIIDRNKISTNSNIDTLILNSGIGWFGELQNLPDKRVKDMCYINFERHVYLTQSVIEDWKKRGYGHLVYICSNSAYGSFPANNVYAGTKAAMLVFARSLANEVKEYGINVSVVSPGTINTPFWEDAGQDNRKKRATLQPEQVADVVKYVVEAPFNIPEVIMMAKNEYVKK